MKKVIEMARDAGATVEVGMAPVFYTHNELLKFAELVRADERAKPAPVQQERPYTYASNQATRCARCGEHKHTPLRIDGMGGYVCLTCIDKQLCTFYGEFGYPEPAPAQEQRQPPPPPAPPPIRIVKSHTGRP